MKVSSVVRLIRDSQLAGGIVETEDQMERVGRVRRQGRLARYRNAMASGLPQTRPVSKGEIRCVLL